MRILHGLEPLHDGLFLDFDMFFEILIFEPKSGFSMGSSLCMHDGRFSKCSHFSNIWFFFERFFGNNSCK